MDDEEFHGNDDSICGDDMMRRVFIFILILLIAFPLFSERKKVTDLKTMTINTSLEAGSLKGVFAGFSSTPQSSGVKPISGSTLTMTLHSSESISEIYSDAGFYVYWVIGDTTKNKLTTATLTWSWENSYPQDFKFKVSDEYDKEKTSGWKVAENTDSSGSVKVNVKTTDLRDTAYTTVYQLNLTLEAVFDDKS